MNQLLTPLLAKLRFRPGMRVCVIDAPSGYQLELISIAKLVRRVKLPRGELDLIHVFVTRWAQIEKQIAALARALKRDGILWVSYPKANGLNTDLNRDLLRHSLHDRGLEAVAQVAEVAVDEVWSALRFKKANGLNTDLNRDLLRHSLHDRGLEAVAQVAVDEVWSALRFKKAASDSGPRALRGRGPRA